MKVNVTKEASSRGLADSRRRERAVLRGVRGEREVMSKPDPTEGMTEAEMAAYYDRTHDLSGFEETPVHVQFRDPKEGDQTQLTWAEAGGIVSDRKQKEQEYLDATKKRIEENSTPIADAELFALAEEKFKGIGQTLHARQLLVRGYVQGMYHAIKQLEHFGMSDYEIRNALGMMKSTE